MAIDKAVDSAVLDSTLTAIANAIREKGGTSDPIAFDAMANAIAAIAAGGGGDGVVLINGKRCLFGTVTSTRGVRSITVLTYNETKDLLGGSLFSNYVCAWWSSALENTGPAGAVYGICAKNASGTPHYMDGTTLARGSMSNLGSMYTGGTYIQTTATGSVFLAGQEYNWIFVEV